MKTFEGSMTIKWYKNDNGGDKRPLTIDCADRSELKKRIAGIKNDFLSKGEDGRFPFSVNIDMQERI